MKHSTRMAAAFALLTLMPAAARPAEPTPAEKAVHYRQGVMSAIGWNFGPMAGMVKKNIPFDGAEFARRAERVAFLATLPEEGFTPNTKDVKSHAKAELWANQEDFKARMKTLQKRTAKLAKVAKDGDLAADTDAFLKVADTCKGCHDKYEQE